MRKNKEGEREEREILLEYLNGCLDHLHCYRYSAHLVRCLFGRGSEAKKHFQKKKKKTMLLIKD